MARTKITDEVIEQINELYCELKVKSHVAKALGISASTVSKYIVPNYVRKADRVIEVFNGRPSVISMDKIASFDGAADLGYFLTHIMDDEREDMEKIQKGIFI